MCRILLVRFEIKPTKNDAQQNSWSNTYILVRSTATGLILVRFLITAIRLAKRITLARLQTGEKDYRMQMPVVK